MLQKPIIHDCYGFSFLQLRNHLAQAEKYQSQQHSLKLDVPEVIAGLVDVRFEQLESSITVDLWQEAFRAIEEIQKLLNLSGKVPRASEWFSFFNTWTLTSWLKSSCGHHKPYVPVGVIL